MLTDLILLLTLAPLGWALIIQEPALDCDDWVLGIDCLLIMICSVATVAYVLKGSLNTGWALLAANAFLVIFSMAYLYLYDKFVDKNFNKKLQLKLSKIKQ